jgi:NADPH-dependent ferric siderophore reductase
MAADPAHILFRVRVRAVTRLTPSFLRITFTGADLDRFADNGDDQRIKVVLPGPGGELLEPPPATDGNDNDHWYTHWLTLPEERRNPMRTYTVRQVRAEQREVDVDFVLHGDGGPASRWAGSATIGDPVQLVGPNRRHAGSTRAVGWNPPPEEARLLIVGDETALPAVASILEGLPASARGSVLIEVPDPDDVVTLTAPAGINVEWLTRDGHGHGHGHGELLSTAVRRVAGELLASVPVVTESFSPEINFTDESDLWDVPEPADLPAVLPVYAWLAGEAGCIAGLRRHLVKDLGLDRRAVAFMGYWRHGVAG